MDKRLTAFLAVARLGTTTAAAGLLNVAQSAITKRVANLESELGTQLFIREHRGMSLTEAGELFFNRAVRIEREYREGRDEVTAIASAGLSEIKIGAGPVFYLNWVADLISTLKQEYPNLHVDLQSPNHDQPISRLLSGDLDVYLGINPGDQLDESIAVTYVTEIEHGIVMRADDPNSMKETIDPSQLKNYRWVSFIADPVTERLIEKDTLPRGSRKPLIEVRTTSFVTGVQLVKTGQFVMSAPLQLVEALKRDGLVIRPASNGMPRRKAGVFTRKSSMGFGAIKAVLRYFEALQIESSVPAGTRNKMEINHPSR